MVQRRNRGIRTMVSKRRRMGERLALLKRIKRLRPKGHRRGVGGDANDAAEEQGEDLGDVPRSILALDDRLLLPSFDSLGIRSPYQSGRKNYNAAAAAAVSDQEEGALSLEQNQQERAPTVGKEEAAKLESMMRQAPSLENLPHYVASLSPSISPDPSTSLPSQALQRLLSLSDYSSSKHRRIAMVQWSAAEKNVNNSGRSDVDDNDKQNKDAPLVPALLAFLKRCPGDSPEMRLVLSVLNNLSVPAENKRPIALDHGGAAVLGRLLGEDPGCRMLVMVWVNLTFGDEDCPLVDPDDPITRRMVARVSSFLDIWREKGLPMDFRPLYGVNTGLCAI